MRNSYQPRTEKFVHHHFRLATKARGLMAVLIGDGRCRHIVGPLDKRKPSRHDDGSGHDQSPIGDKASVR
jgi:hypothetical protein